MNKRIEALLVRLREVEELLGQPDILQDKKKYREITQEHSYLVDVSHLHDKIGRAKKHLKENQDHLKSETDREFIDALTAESEDLEKKIEHDEHKLQTLLVPPDPNDHRNTILEIRAGTGGDEAALFVGDCVRMYKMYADRMAWKYEELSSTLSEVGGYKEYIMVLSGSNVNRYLRFEGGTHRVQRVPDTETQGRVHTSAITVATLIEPDEESAIVVDEKDLRIDTYRSSGAGGQHVNTTDSAVRLTHIPTGIVVYCQEERSQHKNKDKAMRFLKAKLAEAEEQKKQKELSESRMKQVGTGDRSERIRTYNFPQNRITDHRINLTLYHLDRAMEGDLEDISDALIAASHEE